MNLEYKHELDKETAKSRIDEYSEKLNDLQFAGGFSVYDLKKSWTDDEMQISFNIKMSVVDRRIAGIIKVKDNLIVLDVEIPSIVTNFITEKNLENTIRKNLDTILS